jgi:selenocysteine-specific elongation factor
MILGTAGHIDHGKTALVRALTGVDTDRLPEEKRRGITIELGFARLELAGVGTVGIVDVPGHEAFVRTMLAGATGMDAALLVVAADAGVMPQTREHVAILDLLGVPRGVVALTKTDLVDAEWCALVADEVRTLLAGTTLAEAPIVPVSAVTGAGLDGLRAALVQALATARAREADAPFRLPVDRSFTVKGTGTVVTGTVWSGTLPRDAAVRVLPGDVAARVRNIESHGSAQEVAHAGERTALALAGVEVAAVSRGHVVVTEAAWAPTTRLRADVTLLPGATAIGPRSRVHLHVGTTEVTARVVALGGALVAGAPRPVRIVTDQPIVARGGDRLVLRGGARHTTLGGGVITDPQPPLRRTRPFAAAGASDAERLQWMLVEAGVGGATVAVLALRLGVSATRVRALLKGAKAVVRDAHAWEGALVEARATALDRSVRSHVARQPTSDGAPAAETVANVVRDPRLAAVVLGIAGEKHGLVVAGPHLRPAGWAPLNDPAALADRAWVLDRLAAAGREPPSLAELGAERGRDLRTVLKGLEKEGAVLPVEADRWYGAETFAGILAALGQALDATTPVSPSALREVVGVSRKYLMPLLEFCDRRGYTRRQGDGRVRGPTMR